MLWRFVHPQLRLSGARGPYSRPLPLISPSPSPIRALRSPSKRAGTLSLTLILAGKESEGVGAAIKAGPIREGWRGAARGVGAHADLAPRDEGAAWRGPWVRASSFSLWLPSSLLLGEPRPPAWGAGKTGVRPAPCGLQREFRTRRPPPTQAL